MLLPFDCMIPALVPQPSSLSSVSAFTATVDANTVVRDGETVVFS